MRKIRGTLLIVSHVLVDSYEGRYYLNGAFGRHVDAFAARFDKVLLMTCAQTAFHARDDYYLRAPNIVLVPVPNIWHPSRLLRLLFRLRGTFYALFRLPSLMQQVDIMHPRIPSSIGSVGAAVARIFRKPAFVYIAGDREGLLLLKGTMMRPVAWVTQKFLRLIVKDSVCFTTGPILADKFKGATDTVIPVISAAMDAEQIVDLNTALTRVEEPPCEVLFVGGVGEAKGVDVLLQSIRDLNDQGKRIRLRIIGKTPDDGVWLRQTIQALRLQDLVTYQGHMAWDKLIYEYDKSSLFVLPSRGEGVPHVIIEAMSRGVPVVATAVGGIPWIVQNNESGLLIAPGSSSELTAALSRLIDDIELRKRLVVKGLEVAHRAMLDEVIDSMIETTTLKFNLPLDNSVPAGI